MCKSIFFVFVLFAIAAELASQAPTAGKTTLPPGPMQPKVKVTCTQCHDASRITEKHLTRVQWSDELDKMAGLGAAVPDVQRKDFLDYLTTNFGPLKGVAKKKPRGDDNP